MYNQQVHVQPKVLIRPRSSISTEEHRLKEEENKNSSNSKSNVISTLGSVCIFLFIICACLTAALVLIGKNLANQKNNYYYCENQKLANNQVLLLNSNISRDIDVFNLQENYTEITFKLANLPTTTELINENHIDNMTSKIIQNLSFRLPKEIRPIYYDLLLQPNLNEKTFSGNVSIRLKILKPISYIPIHSKKLNITKTSFHKILDNNGKTTPVDILQTFEYTPHEYWVTEFDKDLDIGDYSLNLSFNGSLINRIVGFYQSSYLDTKTGKKR